MLRIFWFGEAPSRSHVLGDDGWIFWAGNDVIKAWRGELRLDADQLDEWRRFVDWRRHEAERAGADYLFVLIPEKSTVYPERLPARITKAGPSLSEQVVGALRDNPRLDLLDLTPVLLEQKRLDVAGDHAYYETGTHWQIRAAIAGYHAILDHLRPRYPGLTSLDLAKFIKRPKLSNEDNQARHMYVADLFPQVEHAMFPRGGFDFEVVARAESPRRRVTRSDAEGPRVVMFHDSFSAYLDAHFATAFPELTMLWSREYDVELIRADRPDLVIDIFVERFFTLVDPDRDRAEALDPVTVRFQYGTETLFKLDVANPGDAVVPIFQASLGTERDAVGPLMTLTTPRYPGSMVLPPLDYPSGGALALYLDVTAPFDTTLEIYFKRADEQVHVPSQRVEVPLRRGRNRRHVLVDEPDLSGNLVISPGRHAGRFEFRALEIRVAADAE